MRFLRLVVFAPAAILAYATPGNAETFVESFDNGTAEHLSISLAPGARYCSEYSGQYGTSGPSLCLFNTTDGTVFDFPSDVYVQRFEFMAGAKNGTTQLTVTYDDGSTEDKPIDGSCCEATVQVVGTEGKHIVSFSIPADSDLWLFDTLTWWGDAIPPTTTTTEPETPESTTTTAPPSTSTVPSSSTSTVVTPPPPPPPDTQAPVETTVPDTTSTYPSTSVAPSTTEIPATTLPPATSTTSSAPPSSTTIAPSSPDTTLPAPPQDDSTGQVSQEPLIQEPPADASPEEKAAFESQVNVFSGAYDNYVPLGSKISVAQRRTVVAVTAVFIMLAPPPSTMRRRQ